METTVRKPGTLANIQIRYLTTRKQQRNLPDRGFRYPCFFNFSKTTSLLSINQLHPSNAKCHTPNPRFSPTFTFIDRIKPRGSANHLATIRILRKTYAPITNKQP
jgi:hypothetical protein